MNEIKPKDAIDETREVLNDLANVLHRHSCGLVNKDGKTVLVKINAPGLHSALAEIDECSMYTVKFRRFGTAGPWVIQ